ncbi:MAG: restriction endonuclease subunit S, partial [Bacteroidota bacterium]
LHMTKEKMEHIVVMLPPLAEQHRIVAKVDQLMLLCDELERRQKARREGSARLRGSMLDALASANAADDVATEWNRVRENFHLLFDLPESVAELRRTVLQLAVRGKLVPQDENDEPADALLRKIESQQMDLVKRGLSRKKAITVEIPPKELDIPTSWVSTRLGSVLVFGPTNGYSPKSVEWETSVKSLTLTATTSGQFNSQHFKYIDETIPQDSSLWLCEGDILVQRGNSMEYVGVAAVYHGRPHEYIYPDLMMKMRVSDLLNVDFIHLLLNSNLVRGFLRSQATGTSGSMPKINQSTVANAPIPLPPLAEQHRIVAKVDQLMAICDNLEEKLKRVHANGERMMEAIVSGMAGRASAGNDNGIVSVLDAGDLFGNVPSAQQPIVKKKKRDGGSAKRNPVEEQLPF